MFQERFSKTNEKNTPAANSRVRTNNVAAGFEVKMIKQYLKKIGQTEGLASDRMLNQLKFSTQSKLLSLTDAGLND